MRQSSSGGRLQKACAQPAAGSAVLPWLLPPAAVRPTISPHLSAHLTHASAHCRTAS
jgi:hypothetical protein